MPPALSDDEQSDIGDSSLPLRVGPISPSEHSDDFKATNGDDLGGKEDEDDEDEDEDVYVVEAIKKHMVDENGDIRFQVKWEGYDSKKDLTWEPEENLAESATDILQEYFNKIGGREAIFEETEKARGKKRGRSAGASNAASKRSRKNGSHPASSTPPASAKPWSPPSGSWEDDVEHIDACEEQKNGKLLIFLNWKNGKKTRHETSVIYKKCPQKMLQFYEKHVRIVRDNKNLTENPDN